MRIPTTLPDTGSTTGMRPTLVSAIRSATRAIGSRGEVRTAALEGVDVRGHADVRYPLRLADGDFRWLGFPYRFRRK